MMASRDSLANHMKTNFTLMHFHKYSLSDLNEMIPWERQVYVDMIAAHIKRENEDRRDREATLLAKQAQRFRDSAL